MKIKANLDEDHPNYNNLVNSMPTFYATGEEAARKMIDIATKVGIDHVGFTIEKDEKSP